MGHGSIYTLSIVSIFHLKDGQNFANFFKSFLAAEFMRHTLIPIIKTGREWTFLIPTLRDYNLEFVIGGFSLLLGPVQRGLAVVTFNQRV